VARYQQDVSRFDVAMQDAGLVVVLLVPVMVRRADG
jgi:hypothetical protein